MNKITKEDRNTFFAYLGWTIPVVLVASWVTFFFIFNQMYAPKAYERLAFFYAAYGLKDNSFHTKMQKELESHACYEVNYYDYSLNDKTIYTQYAAVKDLCDFFVFSETDLSEMKDVSRNIFKEVDDDMLNRINIPAGYEYYSFEDYRYGIKLYDKDNEAYNTNKKFTDYIKFTYEDKKDNFYLVINKSSVNFNIENNHTLGYLGLECFFNHVGA